MHMRKVGLIMTTFDSEAMIELYKGVQIQAQENNITTFSTVITPSAGASKIFNTAEFSIFETVDYNEFDGIIVALNTISEEGVRNRVSKVLESFQNPIVAIDCEFANSYNIHTSNMHVMKDLVQHLITVHQCRKINFVSGALSNTESSKRLAGYKAALAEVGIPLEEERIYEGTFYIEDGVKAVNYFYDQPIACDCDAIVCSNDMVALSVCESLAKKGISVPEDVKVTGFDNIFEGGYEGAALTTIQKPYGEIGKKAVDILAKVFQGEKVEKRHDLPANIIYRKSCGCKQLNSIQINVKTENFLRMFTEGRLYQVQSKYVLEEFMNCNNFEEYLEAFRRFIYKINPLEFYLLLNPKYMKDFEMDVEQGSGNEREVVVALRYMNGSFGDEKPYICKRSSIFEKQQSPVQYVMSPLHFREHNYGYLAFGNCNYSFSRNIYSEWLLGISHSMDNLRGRLLLNKALEQINDISMHDQLTGVYNRLGLTYYWEKFQNECLAEDKSLLIMFIDVNGLKIINDQFGHEHGDNTIATIGKSLKQLESADIIVCRYGGDEFVLFGKAMDADDGQSLKEKFYAKLAMENDRQNQAYIISASVGMFVNLPKCWMKMESCIQMADEKMYKNKKAYYSQNDF